MNKIKWIIWLFLFSWVLKVGYDHYVIYTDGLPFRYTSIADHILKTQNSDSFAMHAKIYMEDSVISDEELNKLGIIAPYEIGNFEMDIETNLNLEQSKQILLDVL
jgi:hypothetical protein